MAGYVTLLLVRAAKWQGLVLAAVVASCLTAFASAEEKAIYEVLETHPDCAGPGKIAYRATFDTALDAGGYFLNFAGDDTQTCAVTVRKGLQRADQSIPCPPTGEAIKPDDGESQFMTFCRVTAPMRPVEMHLTGALTGCMTMEGHSVVGGSWKVTTTRPSGVKVTSGAHDDPRFHADFLPSSLYKSRRLRPSLELWIDVEDVTLQRVDDAAVRTTGTVKLELIDRLQSDCTTGEANCTEVPNTDRLAKVTSYVCGGGEPASFARVMERYLPQREEK